MNETELDSEILAEWALERFARHRTDAQNVVLEAYAEEREAETLTQELRRADGRPRPRLVDLLATSDFLIELCRDILRTLPPGSTEATVVSGVETQQKQTSISIRNQILGIPPSTSTK